MRQRLYLHPLVLAWLILLVLPLTAWAQELDKVQLGLDEALQAAREYSISVQKAQANLDRAKAALADYLEGKGLQWQATLPSASLDADGFSFSESWSLNGAAKGVTSYSLSLDRSLKQYSQDYQTSLTLSAGRTLWPDPIKASSLEELKLHLALGSAQRALEEVQAEVALNAYTQYRSLQIEGANLALIRRESELAEAQLEAEQRLLELGESSVQKVKGLQGQWLRKKAATQKAEAAFDTELSAFLASLQLPPELTLPVLNLTNLSTKLPEIESEQAVVIPGDLNEALAASSELQNLLWDLQMKEQSLAIAKDDTPWSVQMNAGTSYELETEQGSWRVTAGATLDLSGAKARQRRMKLAEDEVRLARQALELGKVQIAQEYAQSRAELEYQEDLLNAAYLEREAAKIQLDVARSQHTAGLLTGAQLAEAELNAQQADIALLKAHLQYETQRYKYLLLIGAELSIGETGEELGYES